MLQGTLNTRHPSQPAPASLATLGFKINEAMRQRVNLVGRYCSKIYKEC